MEWQAIVLTLQILLLAIGWTLFQKARAELSARAAETPILGEVKALHRNVKQLLTEIEQTADQTATRLEGRIETAREVLASLECRLEEAQRSAEAPVSIPAPEPRRATRARKGRQAADPEFPETLPAMPNIEQGIAVTLENRERIADYGTAQTLRESRRNTIYQLADAGEPPAAIARMTKLTEGEVETLLGLRRRQG